MKRSSTGLVCLSLLVPAAAGFSACAQGTSDQPQRQAVAPASTTPDGNPFNVTPPGSGSAGATAQSGKGGAASSLGGSTGSGLSGAGGSAGSNPSPSLTAGASPAAGGSHSNGGASSSSAGANSTADCAPEASVRLPSGACVARITEFSVGTQPMSIATGTDSRIWFDDGTGNQLVQLDGDGQVLARFPFEHPSDRRELVQGSGDAIIWYTDSSAQTVSKRTSSTQITSYAIAISPAGIGLAGNGQLWLTEANQAVYRLDPGPPTIERWPAAPSNTVIVGPDQNVWFPNSATIARLDPAVGESDFAITDDYASDLCAGPDGALWFTQGTLNQIGRMDVDGTLTRTFDLPVGSQPFRIIAGPDGALWFTEKGADKIGRISVKGDITHYPTPTTPAEPYGLTVGSDHNIWFTERSSGKVGRLILDPVK